MYDLVTRMIWGFFPTLDYNDNHDPDDGRFAPKYYVDVTKQYLQEATPGRGNIDRERGYNDESHKEEIEFANWLHKTLGGDIKLLQEDRSRDFNPDYEWNALQWELKSPTVISSIEKLVRKGMRQVDQSGGIMVNYKGKAIDPALARGTIQKLLRRHSGHSMDVMLIINGRLDCIMRTK